MAGSKISKQHEDNPEAAKKVPLQPPRRALHFLGREALIQDLSRVITPGRVVTLYGSAGVGKTAVIAEVVGRLQESGELLQRFPDGLIYYDFHGRPPADSALEFVLHNLGHERLGSLYKNAQSSLAGKQLLLVLDGAEEAHDLAGMISLAPSCGVLIASSRREDVLDKGFTLKGLEAADGQKVLAAWAGDYAAAEGIKQEICDRLGYLPLALRLVGQFLAAGELAAGAYGEWLDLRGGTAQDFADHPQAGIARLLEKSLAHAGEGARQTLAIVGLLAPEPLHVEAAAAALGRPLDETRQALDDLVHWGLLEQADSGYVTSHALVHAYAREALAAGPGQVREIAAYYERLIKAAWEKDPPDLARLEKERPHFLPLIRACEAGEEWQAVNGLVSAAMVYLERQGYWAEWVEALQAGVRAARAAGDRGAEANHLGNLGNASYALGKLDQALDYYEQALAITRQAGDKTGEWTALGNLGLAHQALGQVDQALDFYNQALASAREADDRRGEGSALASLGSVYHNRGQAQQAVSYFQQALPIVRETGDRDNEGIILGSLGNAYAALGRLQEAITYFQQALPISRETGDRLNEAIDLGNLALAHRDLGQMEEAIAYYRQALALSRELGDRGRQGKLLGSLGDAYRKLGRLEKAASYYEQLMVLNREAGGQRAEASALGKLGLTALDLGRPQQAIAYFRQALAINREIGNQTGQGTHLGNLGLAYAQLGQMDQAREHFELSLTLFEILRDPQAEQVRQWLEKLKGH